MISDQRFRSQDPRPSYVMCRDCPKAWRYGCPECAEEFATYHREIFEHTVDVIPHHDECHHEWDQRPSRTVERLTGRRWR